jgi:hypothetical protein
MPADQHDTGQLIGCTGLHPKSISLLLAGGVSAAGLSAHLEGAGNGGELCIRVDPHSVNSGQALRAQTHKSIRAGECLFFKRHSGMDPPPHGGCIQGRMTSLKYVQTCGCGAAHMQGCMKGLAKFAERADAAQLTRIAT